MQTPEFSRPLRAATLANKPSAHDFAATEAECEAVARRLGVEGVRALRTEATARRRSDGGVVMRGRVEAVVTRRSVVSLEPFDSRIEEEFDVTFLPVAAAEAAVEIDPLGDDVEPLVGGVVDVGEIAVQYLALGLEPHPRAPGELPEAADEP